MTATDELRKLLDERGAEYRVSATGYSIDIGPHISTYENRSNTTLDVSIRNITPEQAVEATLGRGECRDTNNRFNAWQCSKCGATVLLMFDDFGEPSISIDGIGDIPHFCPGCGAKVVTS